MSAPDTDHTQRIREFCDELRVAGKERPRERDYRFMVKAADVILDHTDALAAQNAALQERVERLQRLWSALPTLDPAPGEEDAWEAALADCQAHGDLAALLGEGREG